MAVPVVPQVGTGVLTKGAPKFTGYTVVKGTFKLKDDTDIMRTDDGDSNVFNYTGWKPGSECSCDVVLAADSAELAKLNVLTELVPEGQTARSFIVIDAETADFGGPPLKQSLKLAYHAGFTATVVGG